MSDYLADKYAAQKTSREVLKKALRNMNKLTKKEFSNEIERKEYNKYATENYNNTIEALNDGYDYELIENAMNEICNDRDILIKKLMNDEIEFEDFAKKNQEYNHILEKYNEYRKYNSNTWSDDWLGYYSSEENSYHSTRTKGKANKNKIKRKKQKKYH